MIFKIRIHYLQVSQIAVALFALIFTPGITAAAEVSLVNLVRERSEIKLHLESNGPIEYQFDLEERDRKFSLSLKGADYFLALSQYFQGYDIDKLSQCLDEISIVPVSENEAIFEAILSPGMVASVYEESFSSRQIFRIVILFETLEGTILPCVSAGELKQRPRSETRQSVPRAKTLPPLPAKSQSLDYSKIKEQRDSSPFVADTAKIESQQANKEIMPIHDKDESQGKLLSKRNKVEFSGFLLADYLFSKKNKTGNNGLLHQDQTELRAAQISAKGDINFLQYNLALRSEPDLNGESTNTVYRASLGYAPWRFWRLSLGILAEPFGGEQESEINNIPFLERSLASGLSPTFNPGVMLSYDGGGLTHWDVGLFAKRSGSADPRSSQSLTTRLRLDPVRDSNQFITVNLAFSKWQPLDNEIMHIANPESHLIRPIFSIGPVAVDSVDTMGVSALASYHQISVLLETVSSNFSLKDGLSSTSQVQTVSGQSLALSWFFTGEQRLIKQGVLQPITPLKSFIGGQGWGAFEAGIRQSKLFDDQDQSINDTSFGLNWYLNSHFQIKANWIFSKYRSLDLDVDAEISEIRFQLAY